MTCSFLFCCTGYYRYDEGYTPSFAGIGDFTGQVVHPQHWPQDLEWQGKRVVVIGSGATAVTLVPAMARTAEHVTMLQRSPTYVMSLPTVDPLSTKLGRVLPPAAVFRVVRWRNILRQWAIYRISRRWPHVLRRMILEGARKRLPAGFDIDRHLTPSYKPWDQRMCLVPDGDLFRAIRHGRASIVTDQIDRFTETGLRLASGEHLDADVVVTATGLNLLLLGGIELVVDGEPVDLAQRMSYRAMMFEDVPNLAFAVGYAAASWTLKADLTGEYVTRLLAFMDRRGFRQVLPRNDDPAIGRRRLLELQAGYIERSLHLLPAQGSRRPWLGGLSYLSDLWSLRWQRIDDGVLQFTGTGRRHSRVAALARRAAYRRRPARDGGGAARQSCPADR
ncbi:MAG: flavin-containing monooxygenase, partial [Angustibacter sp.]